MWCGAVWRTVMRHYGDISGFVRALVSGVPWLVGYVRHVVEGALVSVRSVSCLFAAGAGCGRISGFLCGVAYGDAPLRRYLGLRRRAGIF